MIELLVVIAIIAVLAAMLFPVLAAAKTTSKCRCCQSNLKQLALATELYKDAFDGRYPVQTRDGVADWNSPAAASNWARALEKYVKNAQIPACPCSPKVSDCKTNCSMAVSKASYPISYLGNGKIFGAGIRDSAVTHTSKTLLFQCGGRTWNRCWLAPVIDEEYGEWVSYVSRSWCNHEQGTNIAFADSHIVWRNYDKLAADLSVFDP